MPDTTFICLTNFQSVLQLAVGINLGQTVWVFKELWAPAEESFNQEYRRAMDGLSWRAKAVHDDALQNKKPVCLLLRSRKKS